MINEQGMGVGGEVQGNGWLWEGLKRPPGKMDGPGAYDKKCKNLGHNLHFFQDSGRKMGPWIQHEGVLLHSPGIKC